MPDKLNNALWFLFLYFLWAKKNRPVYQIMDTMVEVQRLVTYQIAPVGGHTRLLTTLQATREFTGYQRTHLSLHPGNCIYNFGPGNSIYSFGVGRIIW